MRTVERPLDHPAVAAVHAYLSSESGQARIRHALQRRRLPGSLDTEIEDAVLFEAIRYVSRGGEIVSAQSWANQRITARSIDLVRGVIRKGVQEVSCDDAELDARLPEGLPSEGISNAHSPSEGLLDESPLDAGSLTNTRRHILDGDGTSADMSAALVVLAVIGEEVALHPECPQPIAGATKSDAALWAGLWYSGREECFGAGNTVTKRRTRAASRVRAVLQAAVIQATGRTS